MSKLISPMYLCKSGTEFGEQTALMAWVAWHRPSVPDLEVLIAIPNGGERGKVSASKAKAEGVKAGVSDLFLPCARHGYHGLWLELKRLIGGRESPEQAAWGALMRERGYAYCLCHGWQAAASALMQWLAFDELPWEDGSYQARVER